MLYMRGIARYWFVVPILLLVIGLQIFIGLMATQSVRGDGTISISESESSEEVGNTSAMAQEGSSSHQVIPLTLSGLDDSAGEGEKNFLPTSSPTWTPSPAPTMTPTPTPIPTDTPESRKTSGLMLVDPAVQSEVTPTASPTITISPTPRATPINQLGNLTVPILMYHYISEPPPGSDAIREDLSVSPAQFEAHLAYLRQAGYETISMGELADAFSQQTPLPPKPIIITFDDGYRDHYENAFPILRQYGYKGVFFIFTQPIDTYNVSYLSWEMVAEMHRGGMEFGSHSYRHPDMRDRGDDFLVYEIVGSKEAIEERIGEVVRFFSYPSGVYDEKVIQVLKSAHFEGAVTTQWGAVHSFEGRYEMPRIRVRGNDTAAHLAEKLIAFQ